MDQGTLQQSCRRFKSRARNHLSHECASLGSLSQALLQAGDLTVHGLHLGTKLNHLDWQCHARRSCSAPQLILFDVGKDQCGYLVFDWDGRPLVEACSSIDEILAVFK